MISTFPDEWPGAGLLLLRATAGAGLVVQGIAYFRDDHDPGLLALVVAVLAVAVGTMLLIGCLTRLAATIASLVSGSSMFSWFPGPRIGIFETRNAAVLAIVILAAVICLGSGAFSLDARLFGRREIIIPKKSPTH